MARGDVRRATSGKSVYSGVPFDIAINGNGSEAAVGAGWTTDVPLNIHTFSSPAIDGWQISATPAADGTVNLVVHFIEV
jgi:hypothetical protein